MDRRELELQTLLARDAVKKGPEFTLSSGIKSNLFVNCKAVSLRGPSLQICSQVLWAKITKQWEGIRSVAGVSIGGDPLVSGIAIEANSQFSQDIFALIVRKSAKDHGATAGKFVEGVSPDEAGPCVLVEDVVSTGGSSIEGAQRLLEAQYDLRGVISIVDREMGGLKNIQEKTGLEAIALFELSQLIDSKA